MRTSERRRIGVLLELFAGGEWAPHGLSRLMGFLIEGAAKSGNMRFELVVPSYARARVEQDLRQLDAVEGRDWVLHAPEWRAPFVLQPAEDNLADGCYVIDAANVPRPVVKVTHPDGRDAGVGRLGNIVLPLAELDNDRARRALRWTIGLGVTLNAIVAIRDLLRYLLGPIWRIYAVPRDSWRRASAGGSVGLRDLFVAELWRAADSGLMPGGTQHTLRHVVDHMLTDVQTRVMRRLAKFATTHVKVDGWLALTPDSSAAFHLPEPKAVVVAGMGARVFPETSDAKWIAHEMARTDRLAAEIPRLITFSQHVANTELINGRGIDPSRVHVIHHAPVDIAHDLPFLPADRRPTAQSRAMAADLLRIHARGRGWEYLYAFPFEDVDYLVVSTQDRPYKNLIVVAEAVRRLVQRDRRPIKLFMTARLPPPERSATALLISKHGLGFDVVTTPLLPRDVHAALYHCSLAAVHPSLWEGGTGAWPLDEANSLGVPALVADSPAMREFVTMHGLGEYVFPPHDAEALVRLVHDVVVRREAVRDAQMKHYRRRQATRTWAVVADEYAAAVCGAKQEMQ
jgi:glycosyltransferase involved in cell wall biosynthesis